MSAPNQPRFSGVTGLIAGSLVLLSSPALAAEHPVASAREIAALNDRLVPGDSLVLADGDWTNQVIHFQARGTATQPITLRPQIAGKVVLTGNSSVTVLRPEHVIQVNNVFAVSASDALMTGTEGGHFQWRENQANVAPADAPGIRVVDLKLARARWLVATDAGQPRAWRGGGRVSAGEARSRRPAAHWKA